MKAHEFLAKVCERGDYGDVAEAHQVTAAVLGVLAERLSGGEPHDLAAQLPADIAEMVRVDEHAPSASFGVDDFLHRIAAAVNGSDETARWDASAVLCTVAEAVTGGQLNQILTQLQPGYAALFGKPELS